MSAGGWLRGIVKEVPSGDTVVVMAATKSGIPPEKRLTLSSINAPRMGRRDGSTRDDPFAWQSREFLRKLAAGKPCVFRVDYALEAAGGREFGTVFVEEKTNIALASVGAGWSKVRQGGAQQSPFLEDLIKAQEGAEARSAGLYTKDPAQLAYAVRDSADEFDASDFLSRTDKGKPLQAIVEAAINGSTLRVTLLPDLLSATVMVAGVQCPSMGRRPPPSAAAAGAADGGAAGLVPGTAAAAVAAGTSAAAAADGQPEAFAREARHFTELRCLNREVRLVVEGMSQFGVLVASVEYPAADGTHGGDLAIDLVNAGLARAAEWSLNMMTSGAFKLRELERAARQSRVGLWHSYVPQQGNSAKLSDKFTGLVAEIASGDCLVVRDSSGNVERRVNLSSIRAPRGATRDRAADPWATDAKEFLRQRLIGKEVSVSMDYTRKVPVGGEERVMAFGTVTISEKGAGQADPKVNNVAELLLVRGLAQVVKHRQDEERSAHFEDLINAEEAGKKGKKGQWSSKHPPAPHVNDLSAPGSATRAKQYLPFLLRAGKVPGVVEYVLSGSRLKVHVPRESVTITMSPSGVKCPSKEEPLAAEALAFTRSACLQRDVEIEVVTVDKAGTFLGTLRVPPASGHGKGMDVGQALLEAGLAKLFASHEGDHALEAAQARARKGRLGVWEKEDSEEVARAAAAAAAAAEGDDATAVNGSGSSSGHEAVDVVVTDVTDANTFYVQMAAEARAAWVTSQLGGMSLDDAPAPSSLFKVGDACLAQFAGDGQWYRAKVEKVNAADPTKPQYDLFFTDYGNRDRVTGADMRPAPPELTAVPPQAHAAGLAFVRAPGLDAEYGVEAAQQLSELVGGGRRLRAVIEFKERPGGAPVKKGWGNAAPPVAGPAPRLMLTVLLGDASAAGSAEDYSNTVNCALVEAGVARVVELPRGRPAPAGEAGKVFEAVQAAQAHAQRAHLGMFMYGDPGDDEDEDDGGFPSLANKGKKR